MDSSKSISNVPPSDIDAEKSILGSILLNSKALEDIADQLKSEYFYDHRHQKVYKTMLELWAEGKPVDVIFLLDTLKSDSDQHAAKNIDKDFLLDLVSSSSISSSPKRLVSIIKEKYTLRSIVSVADIIRTLALESQGKSDDVLDIVQRKIYELSLDNIDKNFVSINEVLTDTFERINELYNNKTEFRGAATGLMDLDKILGGFHNSDLIILAARPSMGKTSLALEIVKRMAIQSKIGVAFFSLEMSKDQLVDKMIASVSAIDLRKIRSGQLSEDPANNEFLRLGNAIGQLSDAPIWIDDSGSLNIMELRTKARRLKSRHNVGMIVIDYLQLMSGKTSDYGGNRVQEVSDISRGLKMLSKELDIPILALSQLSRSVEGREDKRPMLSDLRESGSIEQDADVVIFVHREEMYHKETKRKGIADILISKHRNGETGTVELAWVGHLATFDNLQGAKVGGRINA